MAVAGQGFEAIDGVERHDHRLNRDFGAERVFRMRLEQTAR